MVDRSNGVSAAGAVLGIAACTGLARAQNSTSDGGGNALGDTIVWAITTAIRALFQPLREIVESQASNVVNALIGTPHPNAVFTTPTNGSWPDIYSYFWDGIVPLSLLLWALSVGLVILLESTSYLFSSYHRAKLKRRAFAGLLGILSWWWLDAFARQFTNELAILLAPDLSNISLFETLSFGTVTALIAVITYSIDFFLLGLVVLIYFIREITLYLFTLLMPIAIALWIPGVGPFSLVSKFMQRLAGFYVPFLFMTVPVALLFRLAELLGNNLGFSVQGLGLWLAALVLPILAIVAPFVLVWQAGSIFFMAQSASRHASARRARSGVSRTRNAVGSTVRGGRNAVRGVRGKPAISSDGQTQLGSGTSRAHAAGSRLSSTGSGLRGALSRSNEGASTDSPSNNGSAGGSDAGQSDQTDQSDQSGRALDTGDDQREERYDPLRGEYLDENYDPIPGPDGDSTGSGAGESRRDAADQQRDQTDGDTANDDTDE